MALHRKHMVAQAVVLQRPQWWEDILKLVQFDTKPFKMPIANDITNLEKTIDGWWRRLLAGVLRVTEGNAASSTGALGNERSKTG